METGSTPESNIRRLWRMGRDTMDIAIATGLPQAVVERAVNRMLDEQCRHSCAAE